VTENGQRWIVIPKWDEFQHYKDRDPPWIKAHRSLLAKDEYLNLSFHLRGILEGLRLSYAASNRQLSGSTVALSRRLGQRVTTRDLESLNHAGFIRLSASKPQAPRKRKVMPEAEAEAEKKNARTRATPKTPESKIRALIANGVIADEVDLEAELRACGVIGSLADALREALQQRTEAA
jgi:hypothetical protein